MQECNKAISVTKKKKSFSHLQLLPLNKFSLEKKRLNQIKTDELETATQHCQANNG